MIFEFPASSPIGSVLPGVGPAPLAAQSLWSRWTSSHRNVAGFGSARAALAALLECRRVRRLWLPAYCCPVLAAAAHRVEVMWYGVDGALYPETEAMAASLRPGDAVLSIAFFGLPSATVIRDLADLRPDVLWIEDRSHAVDAGEPAWADVHLYSPRKIVGVADGGILTSDGCLPGTVGASRSHIVAAQVVRREDPLGYRASVWYSLFRHQEGEMGFDPTPMTQETRETLGRVDARLVAERRTDNVGHLLAHLRGIALWPSLPWPAPLLAFPVCVDDPAGLAALLAERGIYCARHWASLPSDPVRFPEAHAVSARLLSLPCDQHYSRGHMLRIVSALRRAGVPGLGENAAWQGRQVPRGSSVRSEAL